MGQNAFWSAVANNFSNYLESTHCMARIFWNKCNFAPKVHYKMDVKEALLSDHQPLHFNKKGLIGLYSN